jgi:hypothetical protein
VLIAICTHDAADVRTRAPEVPEAVAALVGKALERDRDRRFQSAAEFLAAVTRAESGALPEASARAPQFTAQTPPESVRTGPLRSKRYGTLVAGIMATLSGFALTAYFMARGSAQNGGKDQDTTAPAPHVIPVSSANPVTPVVTPAESASLDPKPPTHTPSPEKPRRSAAPKPSAHVAGGLQLSTKEP